LFSNDEDDGRPRTAARIDRTREYTVVHGAVAEKLTTTLSRLIEAYAHPDNRPRGNSAADIPLAPICRFARSAMSYGAAATGEYPYRARTVSAIKRFVSAPFAMQWP
jgi:hypothetical protein